MNSLVTFLFFAGVTITSVSAKRDFTVTIDMVKILYQDFIHINMTKLYLSKLNHTKTAAFVVFEVLTRLPNTTQAEIQFLQKVGNNFRPSAVNTFRSNICEGMAKDKFIWPSFVACGAPKGCPILPGVYNIGPYVVDEESLPTWVPGEKWRVVQTFVIDGKKALEMQNDFSVRWAPGKQPLFGRR